MQGPKVIQLQRKFDLHSQTKVVDAEKNVRISTLDWSKDEVNVQTMKEFVEYVTETYGEQPCFGRRSDFDTPATWTTYRQMRNDVLALGSAMVSLLEKDSRNLVGLCGRNSPEWVCAQLACGYYGIGAVPLYDTLGQEALDHILEKTILSTILCDTVEHAEAFLSKEREYLRYLIVINMDEAGRQILLKKTNGSIEVYTYSELMLRGVNNQKEVSEPNADDVFLLCYTSGSTGLPKGVIITHRTFLNGAALTTQGYRLLETNDEGNVHVSFLPLAHIMEQLVIVNSLRIGCQIAFLTEDIFGLVKDLAYYGPTVFYTVPRLLYRFYTEAMKVINKNKIIAHLFQMAINRKIGEQKRGIFRKSGLLDYIFFRPIRNRLGGRIRGIVCASAPLQPEVLRFTRAVFSCPLIEGYGCTESGGAFTFTVPMDLNGGHAGSLISEVQVKLIDNASLGFLVEQHGTGEICIKSAACTPGYFEDDEKTKALFEEDGFVRTGDIGRWTESGTLQIVDRCKNIFKLSQGEYIAPEKIEQIYALCPFVVNVYVDGNSLQSYAVAVVVPNFQELELYFQELISVIKKQCAQSMNAEEEQLFAEEQLCKHKKVEAFILDELNKVGSEKGLNGFEKVRAIHLCREPFSILNGLLTPTMKISRPKLRIHFAQQKNIRTSTVQWVNDDFDIGNMKAFVDFVTEKYAEKLCFGRRKSFDDTAVWTTYQQMQDNIFAFGSAMCSLLATDSEKFVGFCGRNSAEWICAQLACGYYGIVSVPLYDTLGQEALEHIMNQTKLSTVVCDTVEHANMLLEGSMCYLRCIIVIELNEDERKMLLGKVNGSIDIHTYEEVLLRGSKDKTAVSEPNPDDMLILCYTSGSTGLPKGVVFTHRTFLSSVNLAVHACHTWEASFEDNLHLSFLPLAHLMEQIIVMNCLKFGCQVAFLTTDISGLMKDFPYYRPTTFCAVPRLLSRIYTETMKLVNKSKFKAQLFQMAINMKISEQNRGIFRQKGLMDYVFFRATRKMFGGRIKGIVCGSAPLQPEVLRFSRAVFSCPLTEGYGSTEAGSVVTYTLPTDTGGGHVGAVVSDVKVKLIDIPSMDIVLLRDGIGEICVKSPACTSGYFKDEEQTKELFDEDGFVRTGDIGCWTECGTLQIIDRCKNMFKLSQGEYVAPDKVEKIYSLSPLVLNIFVDGNSLYSYAVAVVVPNFHELEKQYSVELAKLKLDVTDSEKAAYEPTIMEEALCKNQKLANLVLEELNKIGTAKGLKGFEKVRAVHLSCEPFSTANGLLTPTMKMARPQLRRHFSQQVQALYEAATI